MAASTLVSTAIFLLNMVLIMKMKSEQCIKEIEAKNFKQWILKTILWRHYSSAKGLEKAILKDFQHNMGTISNVTQVITPTLPLPNPYQIVIFISFFDLRVLFTLNWISWIISLW